MPNMSLEKVPMPEQEPNVRNKNFKEVTLGYTEEMAVEEAQRCLNCKHKPCMQGCPVMVKIPELRLLLRESLRKHIKKSRKPVLFRRFAAGFVRRKISAKSSASEVLRASR